MSKPRSFEERLEQFEISLLNQVDFEIEPLTALDRAKVRWRKAELIKERREDAARSNANDKRAKPLRGDLSI